MKRLFLTLIAAGTMVALAQTPEAKETRIKQRKEEQQQRIGQGVASGSLTPTEAGKLEHRQAKLNHEIRHDRKVNGGNLTNKEKKQINRQQNKLSGDIYNKKHNDQVQK